MTKTNSDSHKLDILVVLILFLFSLIVWWPSRYLPYFWDSSGYVINTAYDFYTQNFSNLTSPYTDFAHPPLFTALLGIVWKIFGISQLTSHGLMFVFLPTLLISLYYLSKTYIRSEYALFATALIAFSPPILAEYVNIYVDLPAAALGVLALTLARYNKIFLSSACVSLAIMTKIPAISLLPFVFLQAKGKQKYWLSLPIITTILWFLYHFNLTGWLYVRPHRPMTEFGSINEWLSSTGYIIKVFFIDQGRFVWSSLVILALFAQQLTPKKWLRVMLHYSDIIISLIASLGLFVITAEFAPRYSLYFLPLLALSSAISLQHLQTSKKINFSYILIIMSLALIILSLNWRTSTTTTDRFEFRPSSDLSILDSITSFRQMAATAQTNYLTANIYGGFPENLMLTQSIQGYVSKPLEFSDCSAFKFLPHQQQLVVLHPYAPSQLPCWRLIESLSAHQIHHFETNGKWVELYQIDASNSAKTQL